MRKKKSGKSFYIIALAVLVGAGIITAVGTGTTEKEPENTTSKISLSDTAELETPTQEVEPEVQSEDQSEAESEETESPVAPLPEDEMEKESQEEAQTAASEEFISFQMPIEGTIIKQFDLEKLQYSATFGDMRLHSGIDIVAVAGTPVMITANGSVKSIEEDALMGSVVTLEHAGGYESIYCGIEEIKFKVGDEVKIGKVLGVVGEIPSECLDDDHLHFEIKKDGKSVSPLEAVNMQ